MTADYKKRAKAGWSKDKSGSNRAERRYSKEIENKVDITDSAFVVDLIIKNECNDELNDRLGGYYEQPLEDIREKKIIKKQYKEKDITRSLSKLRWIHKFSKGDINSLNVPRGVNSWFDDIRKEYYQEYQKLLPEVTKLLERVDLPAKLRRQVIEVLDLFK